eukprot:2732619-Prorocentrum_lima.AAC.1
MGVDGMQIDEVVAVVRTVPEVQKIRDDVTRALLELVEKFGVDRWSMSIELAEQTLGKGKARVHVHVCLQRMELQLKVKHARQLALCGAVPFAVRGGQNG